MSLAPFCTTLFRFAISLMLLGASVSMALAQAQFRIDTAYNQMNLRSIISPTAFVDVNGDGWDDLCYIDNEGRLVVKLIDKNQKSYSPKSDAANNDTCYGISVGDLDNDGINEVITSGEYNGLRCYNLSTDHDSIVLDQLSDDDFFAQGSNIIDFNNDGHLDYFVCNDDSLSLHFFNDGNGQLGARDLIDMTTKVPSDNSGNYASEWVDYDLDGDLDLYIAKCRADVSSADDPRRINVLYEQKSTGIFEEVADSLGLAIGAQTWTVNFADLDNDEDLDIFLTNHDVPHQLFENRDGVYIERSTEINNVSSFALHSIVRDFDNNGFDDIFITGGEKYFIYNYGDFQFEIVKNPLPSYFISYFSTGDYNRDGSLDILGTYSFISNFVPFYTESLWQGIPNENNWASFRLFGTESNQNGIGAKLKLYGDWGVQTKILKSGESYGITNSLNVHFGLGTAEHIDSLVVEWPSGVRTNYGTDRAIDANQYHNISEAGWHHGERFVLTDIEYNCSTAIATITSPLSANDGAQRWYNQSSQDSIATDKDALVYLSTTHEDGKIVISDPLMIDQSDFDLNPRISLDNQGQLCADEFVKLSASKVVDGQLLWSTGNSASSILVNKSGTYWLEASNDCAVVRDSVEINYSAQPKIEITHAQVMMGDDAQLGAMSKRPVYWYANMHTDKPFHKGNSLLIEDAVVSDTFYVEIGHSLRQVAKHLGPTEPTGTLFDQDTNNAALIFDTYQDMWLDSLTVFGAKSSQFELWILDEHNGLIYNQRFDISVGRNRLYINAFVPVGSNYRITTNAEYNLLTEGEVAPPLLRSNDAVKFPYTVDGLVSIERSSFLPSFYYYFYDWSVREIDRDCFAVRKPVYLTVEREAAITLSEINISPNPARDFVSIQSPERIERVALYNELGQLILARKADLDDEIKLATGSLRPGVYLLKIDFADTTHSTEVRKIILSK